MIEITTLSGVTVGSYKDYGELCDYIMEQENLKLIESNPNLRELQWSFTVYSPWHPINTGDLPLVVISTGDCLKMRNVVLTPDVDLDALQEQWCREFCSAYDLMITELL